MKSMLESYLTLEQTALLAATLAAQTRAGGSLEAPLVARTLAERGPAAALPGRGHARFESRGRSR